MEYTNENRGYFQHPERAKQNICFEGIKYGNITPTDIDGCIDYKNKATILK